MSDSGLRADDLMIFHFLSLLFYRFMYIHLCHLLHFSLIVIFNCKNKLHRAFMIFCNSLLYLITRKSFTISYIEYVLWQTLIACATSFVCVFRAIPLIFAYPFPIHFYHLLFTISDPLCFHTSITISLSITLSELFWFCAFSLKVICCVYIVHTK